jgi:pimeloyl-ACP methyl ester carboxylesterase
MRIRVPISKNSSSARSWFVCCLLLCATTLVSCSGCDGKKDAGSNPPDGNEKAGTNVSQSAGSHYERDDGKQRVIVFVHGIYGSAADTWKCEKTGITWPKMLLTDHSFDTTDVYVAQYPTHFSRNLMSIDDQVSNLMNRFEADKVFARHNEIVFVAHSMGGLIVQRLLLTHHDLAPKVRFIYFLSTPQEGAAIARLGHALNEDPNLQQMFPGDSNTYLQNIEAEWMGAKFGIPRYCTIERKPTHGVLVVDRESGTRNCEKVVALDEDHAGVAKPCGANDDSYVALRVAEEANPVLRTETATRDWRSYQAVDCSHTNSGVLDASVSLDSTVHERVVDKPTARYDGSDHIKDATGPSVLSYQGNTAKVQYGFNGEDSGLGCHGGHTTIVVTFSLERKVPTQ